jgi:hypothetical protein
VTSRLVMPFSTFAASEREIAPFCRLVAGRAPRLELDDETVGCGELRRTDEPPEEA